MGRNVFIIAVLSLFSNVLCKITLYDNRLRQYNRLSDHKVVSDSNVFPYMVAILQKHSYLMAGALLDDKWVLTAANSLFLVRESSRIIRVRLGTLNYKKGGVLLPVKYIEVHPEYRDTRPLYDVALLRLARAVCFTPKLYPVRLQTRLKEVTATHFIVTAWSPKLHEARARPASMDQLKKRRMLSVSHLHPSEPAQCATELAALDVNQTDSVMCLDPDVTSDPCWRDAGAPVVLNGVLWGVVSSWHGEECRTQRGRSLATLVAAPAVRSWLLGTSRHAMPQVVGEDHSAVSDSSEQDSDGW